MNARRVGHLLSEFAYEMSEIHKKNLPTSDASEIMPRLSRSHLMAQPATAIEPWMVEQALLKIIYLEGVDGRAFAEAVSHGGDEPMGAERGRFAGVEQQEAAGAVGVLGRSGGEALLTDKRRLLISQAAR